MAKKREIRPDRRAGEPVPGEIVRFPGWGFTWDELRPHAAIHGVPPMPPAATLYAPHGVYMADHLTASRNIVALLLAHTRSRRPAGLPVRAGARDVEGYLYGATVQLARAEAAALDAAFWLITPDLADRRAARRFVERRIGALQAVQEHLEEANGMLADAVDRAGNADPAATGTRAGDEGTPGKPAAAAQPDAAAKPGANIKPAAADAAGGAALAKDAINQVSELYDAVDALVKKLVPDKEKDDLSALIAKVAGLILSGGKAALLAALTELIEELEVDARPEDIHIKRGADGAIMVFFRVRKGCLFIFDWAVEDDYIFIRKGGRTGEWEWATGETAKGLHDDWKKAGAGGAAAPTPQPPPGSPAPPVQPGQK